MEVATKSVTFVNWRQHKLEEAMNNLDSIFADFMDDLLFKEVMNFVRLEYGYPGAFPIDAFADTVPVLPSADFWLPGPSVPNEDVKCVCCQNVIPKDEYMKHLVTCAKDLSSEQIKQILARPFITEQK